MEQVDDRPIEATAGVEQYGNALETEAAIGSVAVKAQEAWDAVRSRSARTLAVVSSALAFGGAAPAVASTGEHYPAAAMAGVQDTSPEPPPPTEPTPPPDPNPNPNPEPDPVPPPNPEPVPPVEPTPPETQPTPPPTDPAPPTVPLAPAVVTYGCNETPPANAATAGATNDLLNADVTVPQPFKAWNPWLITDKTRCYIAEEAERYAWYLKPNNLKIRMSNHNSRVAVATFRLDSTAHDYDAYMRRSLTLRMDSQRKGQKRPHQGQEHTLNTHDAKEYTPKHPMRFRLAEKCKPGMRLRLHLEDDYRYVVPLIHANATQDTQPEIETGTKQAYLMSKRVQNCPQ
jgi:outer membrane biosynthesis protein TonB